MQQNKRLSRWSESRNEELTVPVGLAVRICKSLQQGPDSTTGLVNIVEKSSICYYFAADFNATERATNKRITNEECEVSTTSWSGG